MNTAEIFGLLYFGGIAFFFACALVLVQAVFLDITSRSGGWIIPLMPLLMVFGLMLTSAFSNRNLKLQMGGGGDYEVVWVTRMMTVALIAMSVSKVFTYLGAIRPLEAVSRVSPQRPLYVAFVACYFGMIVSPMALSAHPSFTIHGLPALAVFTAVYFARHEPLQPIIKAAKFSLLVMMLGSLVAAVVKPELAIESNYLGSIPGLHSRLWGLATHANTLGSMALLLMMLEFMQPTGRSLLRWLIWGAALTVFVLAQSKTMWLAGVMIAAVLVAIQHGRDDRGRMKMGFVASAALAIGIAGVALLFVDMGHLLDSLEESKAGSNLTTLTGRTQVWAAAWKMWLDSPVFGYGLNAWNAEHRISLGLGFAVHAHNQLMQELSVGGLVAAGTLLVYFWFLIRGSLQASKRTRGVSVGLMLFIAMRCISETPLDFRIVSSGEVLTQLLLFLMIVNETVLKSEPAEQSSPAAAPRATLRQSQFGSASPGKAADLRVKPG